MPRPGEPSALSGARQRRSPAPPGGRRCRPRMRGSGGRARTCDLAVNSRASFLLDHAGTNQDAPAGGARRKERESNHQGREAHPFSRRDTAPVAVLPTMAPAGVEPAPTRVRTGSSAGLSYGAALLT